MPSPATNVFARLHKWATRQDENFLTESLAVVLEQLLVLAPAVGVRLLSRITGGFIDLPPEDSNGIEIQTQVEAVSGRPDLEIRTQHRLVWVEVKAESALRIGQLEGYRVLLGESGVQQTKLILLTRYPEKFGPDDACPDLELRWFEIADWLEAELTVCHEADPVAGFLAQQFLDFLGGRSMTLAQVDKFMPEGVRALSNMMNMLAEAAAVCKVPAQRSATWEYFGLNLGSPKSWIGVEFSEPDDIVFATRCKINPDAAAKLGVGEVFEQDGSPGFFRWRRFAGLNTEEVHFFIRTKVRQMQWLETFLRECLAQARSIETVDQQSTPNDPDEGS